MVRQCQCAMGCTCPVVIEGDAMCLLCQRMRHWTRDEEQELLEAGPTPIPRIGEE